MLADLTDEDNHQKSRSAQYLANQAKSGPENRMLSDLPKFWEVTKDDKFVTARHSLQAIWKAGLADDPLKEKIMTFMTFIQFG